MAKKIDPHLVELLKAYGEDNTSVWDCHGTWVAYHSAVERMAARAGIMFDMPQMIVNDYEKSKVVVCVSAKLGDKREWSFGEVSPANNKNAYPYAMAEKRAKDRVALKLLGMAGFVYSEEEADDFKDARPGEPPKAEPAKAETPEQMALKSLWEELNALQSLGGLKSFWQDSGKMLKSQYDDVTFKWFEKRKDELKAKFEAAKVDPVTAVQEVFPGAKHVNTRSIDDTFPGDQPYTDDELRNHPINGG